MRCSRSSTTTPAGTTTSLLRSFHPRPNRPHREGGPGRHPGHFASGSRSDELRRLARSRERTLRAARFQNAHVPHRSHRKVTTHVPLRRPGAERRGYQWSQRPSGSTTARTQSTRTAEGEIPHHGDRVFGTNSLTPTAWQATILINERDADDTIVSARPWERR
jgi:hypothetical protein